MKHVLRSLLAFAGLVALLGALTPLSLSAPVVVVYPLTIGGGLKSDAGANMATLFATKLAQAGDIVVKPYTPGTERPQFLEGAKQLGADYYVTGYLTPLGDEVSLVTQVVSTYSGTVIYSQTTMVKTYAEAAGQADDMHDAILRHSGRVLAQLDQPSPEPTPSPVAPKNGDTFGLDQIFHHKRSASATAAPKASPSAAATVAQATLAPATPPPVAAATPPPVAAATPAPVTPATPPPATLPPATPAAKAVASAPHPGSLVVAVTGEGEAADRDRVADALVLSLQHRGLAGARVAALGGADAIAHAPDLCAANPSARVLYTASLAFGRSDTGAATSAEVDLVGYDCSGNAIVREHAESAAKGRGGMNAAIERAVDAAVGALPKTVPAA
jgi:hypothetical protein